MALTKITKTGITDASVERAKIGADAVDATKIADDAISEEHLDATAITGHAELSAAAASNDVLLIYNTSSGVLNKIAASNVGLQAPTVSSVSPTSVASGDGTGNYTFVITGTGYIASTVPTLITNGGASVSFDSFTINSSTQITGVIAKSSLTTANEPYDVKVTTAGGLTSTLENQINVDQSPVFVTAAGSLGSFPEQTTISTIDIVATDPDSAGNVSFELQSGSLPAGLSSATVNENGVSKFRITGTLSADRSSFTTSNFVLRAVDAASNTSSRAFSISEVPSGIESFTSSGTFAVPTGVTSADVLVVAGGGAGGGGGPQHVSGGGGGAGGLIFMPSAPVVPGGTVTVTVGDGGAASPAGHTAGGNAQDSIFGASPSPGTTNVLTAKGGSGGGSYSAGAGQGGSGGGGGSGIPAPTYTAGQGIQPTQPGNSGAYGFGNPGGNAQAYSNGSSPYSGGGGGAAGAGSTNGNGGDGKAYTIADGTTSVYYAGGGGGGGAPGAGGGNGGAGNGSPFEGPGQNATASRGSGGGGSAVTSGTQRQGGNGGKGIVIVKY